MAAIRTFLDAGVLIAAYRDLGPIGTKARDLLSEPDREWVSSDIIRLELLPKELLSNVVF